MDVPHQASRFLPALSAPAEGVGEGPSIRGLDRRLGLAVLPAVLLAVGFSCKSDSTTGPGRAGQAANMEIVAGNQQSAQVGTELPAALVVRVSDAQGRLVAGQVVNFRVTSGGGSVFAGVEITNDSGVARERWTLGTSTADSQRVEARAVDNVSGVALTFAVFRATALPGPPTRVDFVQPPTDILAGAVMSPAVQVAVRDTFGNAVTNATTNLTIGLTSGTGTPGAVLRGTLTAAAENGVATFADLSLEKVGGGYTLTATASGLLSATSTTFRVLAGAPARLTFTAQPSDVVAGAVISPSIQIAVQDSFGNVVSSATTTVTVGLTTGAGSPGAILSGTHTVRTAGGVATFADLKVNKAGSGYTLTASVTGIANATSAAFAVTPGAAARLAFAVQPTGVVAGAVISPAVQVVIQDAQGNTVTGATTAVSLALTSGTGSAGAALSGTLTASGANGVATFNFLIVNKAGVGYSLTATAAGLAGATSSGFDVIAGPPARLGFTVQPGEVMWGVSFHAAVQVAALDFYGNAVLNSTAIVTLAITNGTGPAGASLGGTQTAASVNGVARFDGLTINRVGRYTLTATSPGLDSAMSIGFSVIPRLAFIVQPSDVAAGVAMTPAPEVAWLSDSLNVQGFTNGSFGISITSGTGTAGATLVGGTSGVGLPSGAAAFNDVRVDKTGTGYTLTATASDTSGVPTYATTSTPFSVTPGVAAQLSFTRQPTNVAKDSIVRPPIEVTLVDAGGNAVASSMAVVTIGITPRTGAAGATLSGTLTVTAIAGVATFGDLRLSTLGTGYSLTATSAGLGSATTTTFAVTP